VRADGGRRSAEVIRDDCSAEWECRCLDVMGKFFATLGDKGRAVACLEHAADLAEASDGRVDGAPYLLRLAKVAKRDGDTEAALAYVGRAREAATLVSDDSTIAECLVAQAALTEGKDSEEKKELLRSARFTCTRPLASARSTAPCSLHGENRRGSWTAGRPLRAEQSVRSALDIFEKIGDLSWTGECLGLLAELPEKRILQRRQWRRLSAL